MMNKTSAALIAAFAFGLISTAAFAGTPSTHPVPPPPGQPGNPVSCVANCGPPPPPVNLTASTEQAFQVCGDKLSQLRRVTVSEIKSITADDAVRIIPVCETQLRSMTEAEQAFTGRGNAGGLLVAIGQSQPMVDKLADRRYVADDVVGVIVDGTSAVLYVHKQ